MARTPSYRDFSPSLSAQSEPPDDTAIRALPQRPVKDSPFTLAVGGDFTTAHIDHGYVQADRGLIFQPFATLSARFEYGDVAVSPYLNWTNTLLDTANDDIVHQHSGTKTEQYLDTSHGDAHFHDRTVSAAGDDGRVWYESRLMPGLTLEKGDWTVDLKYRATLFPEGAAQAVHEAGVKVSYDLAGLWDKGPKTGRDFSLIPSVLVMRELADSNGSEQTYFEFAIEPQWRFRLWDQQFGVGVPLILSASPDGFFKDDDGGDAALGHVAVGPRASWKLPIEKGDWFLNVGCTYNHFLSDSTRASSGDDDVISTSIGLSVSF